LKKRLNTTVIVTPFPALSETFILNRITGLIDRGHKVDIYASHARESDDFIHEKVRKYKLIQKTNYENQSGQSFVSNNLWKVNSLFSLIQKTGIRRFLKYYPDKKTVRQLTRFNKPQKYDVIHAFFGVNGILAMHARNLGILDGPLAVSFHGMDLSQTIKDNPSIYNQLFQKADLFLPVCEYYKKRLIKLGCPEEKIKVHPSAIDVDQFVPLEKNNSTSKVKMISIGRLIEKKGFKYSIRAVAEYMKENPSKEITYRIIGGGPLHEELQSLIGKLNLSHCITIWDFVNQSKIVSEVQNSDILICPSVVAENGDEDTVPNVLKEAMACELPVIATWHGGIPELVQHEKNGFLVQERDVIAIKEKIDQLVNSPSLRNKMGKRGREYVQKNYEIESQNDIILSEYITLANNYPNR